MFDSVSMQGAVPRRRILAGAGALTATAALGACGGSGGAPGGAGGSRLRAAFSAGGSQETLDPHRAPLFVDQARAKALYDSVLTYKDDMSVQARLAESWDSDRSGTRWTVRLRRSEFHDGSPVTAADVLWNYRRIADPAVGAQSAQLFSAVDFAASRARGRELTLVLKEPDFEFASALAAPGTEIVPRGTKNFAQPVGSGPFRYGSFTPGGSAVFRAWDGHWSGGPHIEELEFVPVNEERARVNALLSGQVHYAHDLSAASAGRLDGEENVKLLQTKLSTMQALLLRLSREPFSDARLVEAFTLGLDREALVKVALSGRGTVGNDLFGRGLRGYPQGLPPRERDVDRARALVKAAGAEGLHVRLETGPADASWQNASSLIAGQLKEIGLVVEPNVRAAATYFGQIKTKGVAAHSRTATLPVPTHLRTRLLADAPNNLTGYHSARFDRLIAQAAGTRDEKVRLELLARAQRLARDASGQLVWGFSDWIVGLAAGVRGLREAPPNSCDWARFDTVRIG
ncbi:ABC transporter substrate-binding protein [Streptomyces tubbatahanensis]|uniref:ABC transporter substrate-binding protein n=1 Tax=Streptomyces tubbatahanensis TaxID=2923272 RepID=A0ABY3XLJ5_9ACTN|nr:ABC transporter substrate-binding protein [Streptomyces tubbatahanensis]UNS95280.1 ABC transporter substrate-binding protein [Streptomyces tubbatahanensis]